MPGLMLAVRQIVTGCVPKSCARGKKLSSASFFCRALSADLVSVGLVLVRGLSRDSGTKPFNYATVNNRFASVSHVSVENVEQDAAVSCNFVTHNCVTYRFTSLGFSA